MIHGAEEKKKYGGTEEEENEKQKEGREGLTQRMANTESDIHAERARRVARSFTAQRTTVRCTGAGRVN